MSVPTPGSYAAMPYDPAAVTATRFTLVRHAESLWNASERWQGHGDPPLSERGFEQARRCAERLADLRGRIDRLVCSDLLRTRQTAAAIAQVLELEARPTPKLRELEIGRWTGMRREEIAQQEPELLAAFDSGQPHIRPGGGETRLEIRTRVRGAVEGLAVHHPGAHLILVVHAGVIKALVPEANPGNTESIDITLEGIRRARPTIRVDATQLPRHQVETLY
ncbi:MAG: histidine phosphatase family protein [Myxococcota bacterium]|jgi:probable phosphoglycerate mutase|nr:histidine phosphatase family protein [Myxococcota bacterium]